MNFLNDIYSFIKCLSFVDVVFLLAVTILIILIVTLIYFIKINKEVLTEKDILSNNNSNNNDKKEDIIDKIVKEHTEQIKEEEYNDEEGELLDLEGLTKKLKEEQSDQVNINKYEQEQEEKAIISYDELLKRSNQYAINYEKEEVLDDLTVKKVNLNDLISKENKEVVHYDVQVISYEKEEDFLKALKELNRLLN